VRGRAVVRRREEREREVFGSPVCACVVESASGRVVVQKMNLSGRGFMGANSQRAPEGKDEEMGSEKKGRRRDRKYKTAKG
jgi:hypothetical protein